MWNKAAQDELAIRPGQRCIADLLLLSCRHYAELIAFRKTYSSQLRQFYGLCKDAEHARPPADEADSDTVLGKRRWQQGGSDSANSAATTPRSAASTPTGWPGTASRNSGLRRESLRLPHWRTELTAATRGELGAKSNIPPAATRAFRVTGTVTLIGAPS